jgi:hypothetical protein
MVSYDDTFDCASYLGLDFDDIYTSESDWESNPIADLIEPEVSVSETLPSPAPTPPSIKDEQPDEEKRIEP